MGSSLGPKQIVTDGLVLHLDAGNRRSYPGSGTTWYDLSGNGNDGTLTNGPTFSGDNVGGILFDGVDDLMSVTGLDSYQNFTFDITSRRTSAPTYDFQSFVFSDGSNNGSNRIGINTNFRLNWRYRKPDGSFQTFQTGTNYVELNELFTISATYDGNNIKFYKNGSLTHTFSSILFFSTFGDNIVLGRNPTNNANYNGDIYTFKLYNYTLSAQEVLQNYNATKERFTNK